jgi:hypothetical protein
MANLILNETTNASKWSTIKNKNRAMKLKSVIMKFPMAGPIMLAMPGITTEYRLIVLALSFILLNLNWSRLKLGQNVAMLKP